MDLREHFKTATEKFEFTVNLGGWGGKKVFDFIPPSGEKYNEASVWELGIFGKSMNVKSITKGGLMLYSFDLLGNKITAKIKWEDIQLGNTLDV